jgi:hypothetical protein
MGSVVEEMRSKAARCRELAASATDSEVAKVLLDTAGDIEAAIPILEGDGATRSLKLRSFRSQPPSDEAQRQ